MVLNFQIFRTFIATDRNINSEIILKQENSIAARYSDKFTRIPYPINLLVILRTYYNSELTSACR